MPLDSLPDHLARVALFRDANRRFLGLTPEALADWLVAELLRAGVVEIRENKLCAT